MTVASNVFITHAGTGVMLYRILCVEHTTKYTKCMHNLLVPGPWLPPVMHAQPPCSRALAASSNGLIHCQTTGLGTCVPDLKH